MGAQRKAVRLCRPWSPAVSSKARQADLGLQPPSANPTTDRVSLTNVRCGRQGSPRGTPQAAPLNARGNPNDRLPSCTPERGKASALGGETATHRGPHTMSPRQPENSHCVQEGKKTKTKPTFRKKAFIRKRFAGDSLIRIIMQGL